MQVNVLEEDTVTVRALNADLREVIADDDHELLAAEAELKRVGRYWIGGGAAPIFYLTRA